MSRLERVAAAAYRGLLLLLPARFRDAYRDEMAGMFEDRQRRLPRDRGMASRGHLRLWRREFVNLLATAARARSGRSGRADALVSQPPRPQLRRGFDMDSLLFDIKTAIRAIRANPSSAVIALIAFGLGVGANAAIFSVVHGVLQPLPYQGSERLMLVSEDRAGDRSSRMQISAPEYLALEADRSPLFEELAAWRNASALLEGEPYPESVAAPRVTHDFLDLIGTHVELGREFTESDEADDRLVVIGYDLWQRRWGGDPEIVGSTVILDGRAHQVIGVADPDFIYIDDSDMVFTLLGFTPQQRVANGTHNLLVLGRLGPDVSVDEVDERIAAIVEPAQQLDDHGADDNRALFAYSLYDAWVGAVRQPLLLLMGAVAVLALIACTNVANLEIARGLARRREIAVRLALGARAGQIARQLLIESTLLALIGGIGGTALAWLSMSALRALIATNLPRADRIELDMAVFGFALAMSVACGVLAGLAPAWIGGRQQLTEPMKESSVTVAGGRGATLLRKAFLVAQVAMALVLMVGAGLLLRSIHHLRSVDMGFDARNVLIGGVALRFPEYTESPARLRMLADLEQRLLQNPSIDAVGATNLPPGAGWMITEDFTLAGPQEAEPVSAVMQGADPGFFRALRVSPVRGRLLVDTDLRTPDSPVVLVNDEFARQHWGLDDAVGQRLRVAWDESSPWMTVVGVVPAMRASPLQGDTTPAVYLPTSWRTNMLMSGPWLIVRSTAEPEAVTAWVRSVVGDLDDRIPAPRLRSLDQTVANTFARQHLNSVLLAVFAGVALVLAAVGEYAVIQYVVRQRVSEIGIRIALGARSMTVIGMVARQGLALAVVGVAVGCAAAWAASRLIASMLHGVQATDPPTYVATAVFLIAVAGAASLVPAWRAGKVDPMITLRDQ